MQFNLDENNNLTVEHAGSKVLLDSNGAITATSKDGKAKLELLNDGCATVTATGTMDLLLVNETQNNKIIVGGDGNIVLQVVAGKRIDLMGDVKIHGSLLTD